MTDRKTLQLRDPSETADDTPALKKKGRGWEISEKRLDALHERARDMRRHSSPAHKALAKKFAEADMGRYKFTRHAVVGSAIVDLNCHNLGLAIMIDEDDADEALGPEITKRRDKSLEAVGIRVERVAASDILENMDEVLQRLTVAMRECIADKKEKARAHAAANPNQHYSRPNRKPAPRRNDY
ncbi:endonuclease domain-containing protein [Qipengyuania sp. RANM35]|uniref:endonuclease domain-containing protein n=1 Tax=Qipengyuania sp. RANM35 TaxID=3068635 RepID=UPI0034DB40C4